MALSMSHLKQVFDKEIPFFLENSWLDEGEEFDTLRCGFVRSILTVIHFIINLHPVDDRVNDLVNQLNDSAKCFLQSRYFVDFKKFFQLLVSSMEEQLKVFFSVPKGKLTETTWDTSELVAFFLDFLVGLLEIILQRHKNLIHHHAQDPIKGLQTELKFLITFLGDTSMEETKSLLAEIEAFTNEVGSFIYSFILRPSSMVTGMDLAISDFRRKIEAMKMKITENSGNFPPLQSLPPKSRSVISIFVVDSLIENLRGLMDQNADKIGEAMEDQIRTIHNEMLCFRDITIKQRPELEEVIMQVTDTACQLEYLIKSFAPIWYLEIRLPHFVEKIKLIRMAFEEMRKNETGMLQAAKYPREPTSLRAEKPEEIVVGIEDEAKKIKDQLLDGSEHRRIISIFGMPGLGKTTLAKKIYHDPSILYHFDKRAWCIFSQTYQKRNILIDILRSLSDTNKDVLAQMDEDGIGQAIYKSLKKSRRYLIVIDDIWNIEAWNDLKSYFPNDKTQSRILFTTRIKDLALQASPHSLLYELPFLPEAQCWDLLQLKVYCPPELQEIGKKIAANCRGLPLAVVLIAAVLANMEKEEHCWRQVASSLSSHITEDPNKCMNILELSFDSLPLHLKPCFLYLAVFEEDKEILVRKLISLWIAEGFIRKEEHKNVEIVAEEYLMELIGRSLLIVASRRSDGGVKACHIHDLLRDMCLRIAKKANFLKVIEYQLPVQQKNGNHGTCMHSNLPQSRFFGLHISSLFFDLPDPQPLIIQIMKFLNVLELSTTDLYFYKDVIEIKMPFNLRYVAVPCTFPLLKSFKKLEFLYVDNKELVEIPHFFLDMVNLRHLHFSGSAQFNPSSHLPAAKDDCFPINNLQNVSILFISDEKDEKIVRGLPNLYRLKCKLALFWDPKKFAFRYPAFDFLHKLESLSASVNRTYLSGRRVDLTIFPSNLKKLTLHDFDLTWKEMEMIGTLPNLKIFKLRQGSIEKRQWDASEVEFKELIYLKLDGVPITKWIASRDNFPMLERLVLRKCNHLKEIPVDLGYIVTLQTIEVQNCKKSVTDSVEQIKEKQKEYGNEELKVIISHSQGIISRHLEIFENPSK